MNDDPHRHLPLSPSRLAILSALGSGPLAGFAILEVTDRISTGVPILGPGTLYRLLRELRQEGLIERTPPPPEAEDDDDRRQYHGLTQLGRAVLIAEAARLRRTLSVPGLLDPQEGS